MFFLHELHALSPAGADDYERHLREEWAPALAASPGARLVWCARSMPGAVSAPEIVTMTAVPDGAALADLSERRRHGDLHEPARAGAGRRLGLTTRILAPLNFSTYAPDLEDLPIHGDGSADAMYIHDFVPPRHGKQRPYEEAMATVFTMMMEMDIPDFAMWGGFETVAGGGPCPENVMITLIRSGEGGVRLLTQENQRADIQPGTWMYDALLLRDTWTSRLLRILPWSPTS